MIKLFSYISILLIFTGTSVFAGEQPKSPKAKTILLSGKVQDLKNNELLAGVKISCNNCDKVFYSDLGGRFFIYLESAADQNLNLEFSQIGYSSKKFTLQELQAASDNLLVDLKSE